ncbi:MAG: hypothetical protein FJ291_22725 [Planctomycetes bacterium]|nr:hypothetical protein [Planctomycetota bacterium]
MTQDAFKPTIRKDGTLDPECFAQAGQRWVTEWLRARLSGTDPYFPIDLRSDEDPEALVAGILRDAGLVHPGSCFIARAVLSLLERARKVAPRVPRYFGSLVALCELTPLPTTGPWFAREVRELAADSDRLEKRWGGYEQAKEIVFAAMVQCPGLPSAASREAWEALLMIPRYATLALLAVGTSFREEARHLKDWWHHCPAGDRERDLDQMIFTALKAHAGNNGGTSVQAILRCMARRYPPDLKEALDHALVANGADPAFEGAEPPYEPVFSPVAEGFQDSIQKPLLLNDLQAKQNILQKAERLVEPAPFTVYKGIPLQYGPLFTAHEPKTAQSLEALVPKGCPGGKA